MPEIVFFQRGEPLLRFPINRSSLKIGRSPECDVVLAGEAISRVHLMLYQLEGSYLLKNVGKKPFEFQGKPIENLPLKDGNRVRLEDWELLFTQGGEKQAWAEEETYVSRVEGEGTQVLQPSLLASGMEFHFPRLSIQEPNLPSRSFNLQQEVTTLGKGKLCDLVLEDPYCSDTHCKLIIRAGKIVLFDLNSTNGSFVNGVRVREAELEEGIEVRLGQTKLQIEIVSEKKKIEPLAVSSFGPFVGKSPAMQQLYGLIQQVAPTDASVCVIGETGAGKELVARSLHDFSSRRSKPFVALNCGAISRELIESELFGHEKGAFTGAHQQRQGAFEQASGGTLFLDEIGELPLELQPTLLRVLETGKLRRVGASQEISVNVRVVCATHRDLALMVSQGKFREDLFFRLFVFPIFIPPLRDRREDILLLAESFLKAMTPHGKTISLTPEAARYLESQPWKGNVRELKNVIQRGIVLAKNGQIGLSEINLSRPAPPSSMPVESSISEPVASTSNLQELEKQIILRELRVQGGNRAATARALGIAKSTLYEKLKLYGIEIGEPKSSSSSIL